MLPGNPSVDSISLFCPMLNEEGNIGRVVASALKAVDAVAREGEVIVVNDGSRDGTGAIADRLSREDPRVRVVHHLENRGYGAALRSGFEAAHHALVGFVDGDNQFDIGELRVLLAAMGHHDVVSGYRLKRRDPIRRRINASAYNLLMRAMFDIPIRDVNCGFKVYRRELLMRVLPHLRATGALINVEMLAHVRRMGGSVGEVGVHHYPRTAGSQTGGNPAVILRAFRELVSLARELR